MIYHIIYTYITYMNFEYILYYIIYVYIYTFREGERERHNHILIYISLGASKRSVLKNNQKSREVASSLQAENSGCFFVGSKMK